MPMFAGERPATRVELLNDDLVYNALPVFEAQTGLRPFSEATFHIVRTLANGGWEFVVARPFTAMGAPDPDRWWIWDADVDESQGWVSQATFTPDGFIAHDGPSSSEVEAALDREVARMDLDEEEAEFDRAYPPAQPRDPNAPVTATIELDDHETAEREGLRTWEEHEHFAVLVTESGFAVVNTSSATGIVRYPDKTACVIRASNAAEARVQAEKFLAKRPYTTAFERVLREPEFDVSDPEVGDHEPAKTVQPSSTTAQAKPGKRVWATVPIQTEDDD